MAEQSELTRALAELQASLPSVGKDQKATVKSDKGSYTYSYADLADITAAVLPLLSKVGLAWTTRPTIEDGKFVLRYQFRHVSGEMLEGAYPLPSASRPQEIGSAITYARRYALCAVTGVAPANDDQDAAQAERAAQSRERTERELKDSIWSEAKNRGWIGEGDDFSKLQDEFAQWNGGGDITAADVETLKGFATHLRPKQTMQRGRK
ncbi:ERF family protein [Amycolatopsis dendrobii]|uniref:ERF family protein n=1 Tax=Amycolatopsis dendrobii TaxID=2760662 RepID=A0A7W3VVP1_9PSEU|nr:ERF family protein [Amycolatopsis dendrobii]MBB1153965.1 ERF family protein [Amycolatopsis dendrobii]